MPGKLVEYSRRNCVWLVALLALCCASCSDSERLNPVVGQVLYKNEPLKGVLVTLHPKDKEDLTRDLPVGLTGEDGTFKLVSGQDEGALAGDYIVTFVCSAEIAPPKGTKIMSMGMESQYDDRFKGVYAEKGASKFQVSIQPGPNQLEPFRLK
jgi:hypothetical protein